MNKNIDRDHQASNKIFDNRSLDADYATIIPLLRPGMRVLDVGCGTGAISRGIAERVGSSGYVTGIDNSEQFIVSGRESYGHISNLELVYADLFAYEVAEQFDLIVSARTLQWLNNPLQAILKLKTLLKPGGWLSILDYDHEALQWQPQAPESMQRFYQAFLQWRADAGMNNHIAEDLVGYFGEAGFHSIGLFRSDEISRKGDPDFMHRMGIWSKVAGLRQIVDEGYATEDLKLQAIAEYDEWIRSSAEGMIVKLNEVRGQIG